ncbi:SMI1/KNR4 family protein [Massilia sp. B-10]|nr:SMI1/KNR4 family protein [Massilia sp. B-10]UUZ54365.1 SMI1/KNR4 family protein [Massilia sp. H-1]
MLDAAGVSFAIPKELLELYEVTNGLEYEWFKVLPIHDEKNVKRTWDSLEKANRSDSSRFNVDDGFLGTYLVFAEIGAGACAAFDRRDGTIWYEDEDELHQTDLDLAGFLEASLKEVDD